MSAEQKRQLLDQMFDDMKDAARDLEFERAGEIRDEIEKIKAEINEIAGK